MTGFLAGRREFLRITAGAGAAILKWGQNYLLVGDQKTVLAPLSLVIVVFGGGTRSSESIADPEYRYIPRLWKEMAPQGTLWTNMRVEHRPVHPNSVGSIMTGHWE
jgi:hypothetical protein